MEHAGSSYSSMVALCHDLAVVTVALAQNIVWCFCPFAGARLSYPGPCTSDPSQAGLAKGLLGTCERAPKHGGSQLLRWEQGQEKQNSSAQAPLGRHTPAGRRSKWRRKRRRMPKKSPWRRSGGKRTGKIPGRYWNDWWQEKEDEWSDWKTWEKEEEEEAAAAKAREDQKQPAKTKKEEPEEERNVLRGREARWKNRTGSSKQKSKLRWAENKALEEGEDPEAGCYGGLQDEEAGQQAGGQNAPQGDCGSCREEAAQAAQSAKDTAQLWAWQSWQWQQAKDRFAPLFWGWQFCELGLV